MDKPPRAGGAATHVSMANQKWQRMRGRARLKEAKLRKAGGARKERKGPMVTFRGALGAGAKPQRKDAIVTDQRELLLTMDEQLRWKEGGKTGQEKKRREEGKRWGSGGECGGSPLSEEGRHVTAESLTAEHHHFHPTIGQLRGTSSSRTPCTCIRITWEVCYTTPSTGHRPRRNLLESLP